MFHFKKKRVDGSRRVRVRTARTRTLTPRAVATGPAASSSKSAGERLVLQLFRRPFLSEEAAATLARKATAKIGAAEISRVDTEQCFNVETTEALSTDEMTTLQWLLRETFEPDLFASSSAFADVSARVVEVGPRLAFQSAWSTNAVGVCRNCGLEKVTRLERSRRFSLTMKDGGEPSDEVKLVFASIVHDRMTECVYDEPLATFATDASPEETYTVPVLAVGRAAPSAWTKRWASRSTRRTSTTTSRCSGTTSAGTPRTSSCSTWARATPSTPGTGSLAGTSSWTDPQPASLFKMVKDTIAGERGHNSVIAFKDNSSAIRGFVNTPLRPLEPGGPSALAPRPVDLDLLLTAETHNFPSGVAPYPGAETGAGGRMRDTHATGIGSLLTAGTAGYCVGNLHMDGNAMAFETETDVTAFKYPSNLAPPLQILVDASNGASDYGNKFGEPLIAGYCRSFASG